MSNIRIEYVRGKDGLQSIKKEWEIVTAAMASKHYFHLYEWHHSYINSLEEDDRAVHFFVFYNDDRPMAVFPMVLRKKRILGIPIKVLRTYPDTYRIAGICDFSVAENNEPLLQLLKDYLKNAGISWHVIHLSQCLEDSCIIDLLNNDPNMNSIRKVIAYNGYVIKSELDRISEELVTKKNKKSNRKLKQLKHIGNVEIKHTAMHDELKQYFDQFMEIEDSGWKGSTLTSVKSDPNYTEFFCRLVDSYSEINGCEISLMDIDGHSIAGIFALMVDDTYYTVKIGYDEAYSKMSPGLILMEHVFRHVSKKDTFQKCNLITHTDWMARWNPNSNAAYRILIFNRSVVGRLGDLGYRIDEKIRSPIPQA